MIDAILLAIMVPQNTLGQVYNITNGDPIRFWDLADHLFKQLHISYRKEKLPYSVVYALAALWELKSKFTGTEPPITRYTAGIAAKSCTMTITKAEKMLGYKPKQTNLEAIDEFVGWYKK